MEMIIVAVMVSAIITVVMFCTGWDMAEFVEEEIRAERRKREAQEAQRRG
jgi:hypothetical protein